MEGSPSNMDILKKIGKNSIGLMSSFNKIILT